jgi:hypothetical protein
LPSHTQSSITQYFRQVNRCFAEKTFREKGTVDEKGLWTMWIMWRNPFCEILSSTKNVEKWRKTGKYRTFW